jgi:hypothetical protein
MEGQPPYFVVPGKVQERINEFCLASNCNAPGLGGAASPEASRIFRSTTRRSGRVPGPRTSSWLVDEQECVALSVVRAIAFAKAADDYHRSVLGVALGILAVFFVGNRWFEKRKELMA